MALISQTKQSHNLESNKATDATCTHLTPEVRVIDLDPTRVSGLEDGLRKGGGVEEAEGCARLHLLAVLNHTCGPGEFIVKGEYVEGRNEEESERKGKEKEKKKEREGRERGERHLSRIFSTSSSRRRLLSCFSDSLTR